MQKVIGLHTNKPKTLTGISTSFKMEKHMPDEEKEFSKIAQEKRPSLPKEFWLFLRVRKKWWLAPIIIFLFLLGALIIFTEGSAVAPFIYTLF